MTRRQNLWFIAAGVAGIGAIVFSSIANKNGYLDNELRQMALTLLPFVGAGTFMCLVWFGLAPWLGTYHYLQGYFDDPKYAYMHQWPHYRFVFLITDLPSVVAKRGNAP
jgi:hypothetical protein